MNEHVIAKVESAVKEIEARENRVCQDVNASLMLRGALDLLIEADTVRAEKSNLESAKK